ncbi:MAG: competence/damage-inducible protein A [Succinivibrio sp.]
MKAEIISTGDEVITGMIDDTNATWLCSELLSLGLQVARRSTCSDNVDAIAELIAERSAKADLLFINGGLGPTTDDNTARAAAMAAGVRLVRRPEWVERMKKWHEERGRPMAESNLKQADLPEGAEIIDNRTGTACGILAVINGCRCFLTPGVPSEFKIMMREQIFPMLARLYPHLGNTRVKRLFLCGVSESALQQQMNAIPEKNGVVFGYRAAYPLLELKVIAHGTSDADFNAAVAAARSVSSPWLVCEDEFDPSEQIALASGGRSFFVSDTLTGGDFAFRLSKHARIAMAVSGDDADQALTVKPLAGFEIALSPLEGGKALFSFADRKNARTVALEAKLSITVGSRARDAYALLAEMVLLRLLKGEDLPKPQLAELKVL